MSSFDTILKMINTPIGKLLQDTHDALEALHHRSVESKKEMTRLDQRISQHVEEGFQNFTASYARSLNELRQRVSNIENYKDKKIKTEISPLKELYEDDGTTGLPTRGSKLGKRVAGKRKKKGTRTGSHGLRKKPDDSGDSPVAAPKKRGRPPLNRVPSK